MARSYTPRDFIQLPALDANQTVVVVRQIEASAKHVGHLPASVTDALAEAVKTTDALDAELGRDKRPAGDPVKQRAADHAVDVAWGAFVQWLLSWMALPDDASPNVARAHEVHGRLFPDGMKFLTLAFRSEWAESERRLKTLHAEGLDDVVAAMGGKAFTDVVKRAHKAYGAALGIDAAAGEPDPSSVRAKRDAAHDALRVFVAEVASASGRKRERLAHEAATALLAPITTWTPSKHAGDAAAGDGAGDSAPDGAGAKAKAPEAPKDATS